MSATLQEVVAQRVYVAHGPISGTEVVRRTDLPSLLAQSGTLPAHTHAWADIAATTRDPGVRDLVAAYLDPGDVIRWDDTTPAKRKPVLVLKNGGALLQGGSGLQVDLGPQAGKAAAGDHSHDDLHPALTVADPQTLTLNLDGQQLSAEVRYPAGSGLAQDASGLHLDFGTGHNQVARGDHEHSGTTHPRVSASGSATLDLYCDQAAQVVSGTVRRSLNPVIGIPLSVDADGLYVATGSGTRHAATGDHTHATATASVAGFLSSQDYQLLRALEAAAAVTGQGAELLAGWRAETVPAAGSLLPGVRKWSRGVRILSMRATAVCGATPALSDLRLQWDGATTAQGLSLQTGTPGAEVTAESTLAGFVVPPNTPVRITVAAAAAAANNRHAQLDLSVNYEMAEDPQWKINCGGPVLYPWLAERGSNGGTNASTGGAIVLAGLTDPAPESVYQSARGRTDGNSLIYTLSGLVPRAPYRIRLHWADISFGLAAGMVVMNVTATSATAATLTSFDPYVAAPGANRGVIRELDITTTTSGTVEIQLNPTGGSTRAFLNGIEAVHLG